MSSPVSSIPAVLDSTTGLLPTDSPDPARRACAIVAACVPSACLGGTVATHYAEQARLHQQRARADLEEVQTPRAAPLSPAERQALLIRALEQAHFACRLLLRAEQELQGYPCTCLESRLTELRALAEALEQQLYRLVS